MRIVIDASCAYLMLAAPERVIPVLRDVTDIVAPELIVADLLNARWKMVRAGAAAPMLDRVLGLLERVSIIQMLPYARDAARLAQRLDHPIYDCIYAVVAERERAHPVTADRRFATKLGGDPVRVITV